MNARVWIATALGAVMMTLSACSSMGEPWWTSKNTVYYTGSGNKADPAAGAPDKVEGRAAPAVQGPTN